MSQIVNIDGPTSGQLQGEQTNSCYRNVVEVLKNEIIFKLKIDRQLLVSTLYAIGVLVDYLFVYIAMIIRDHKCIRLNKTFGFSVLAIRSLLEIINVTIFYIMFDFKRFQFKVLKKQATVKYILRILLGNAKTRQETLDLLMLHQFLSIILVSIVYQVMLVIAITIKGKKGLIFIALNYLLWLHLPRLFLVITILLKRPRTTATRLCTKLARLFFFLYVYSSQIFAALWYLPAIYKETRCWQEAFKNSTSSVHDFDVFKCDAMSSEQNKFVNDYCYSIKTNYDFGLYKSVHESGVLETRSSVMQILYFSRWALQCLSSFGQGLEAGANFSQNIFIILMIVYGVFMFFFLIGEVQSDRDRFLKLTPKLRATEEWMEKNNLSRGLKSKIKKYKQNKSRETRVENLVNMLSGLSKELTENLTREICFDGLKKVEEFGKWSEASLMELCDNLKPICYAERTQIIKEGDPTKQMIFVVQGVLWTYTKSSSSSTDHDGCNSTGNNGHLKEGDFHGNELVKWLQADPYTYDLPLSSTTVEAITDVEAFVLMSYDLRKILINRHEGVIPILG